MNQVILVVIIMFLAMSTHGFEIEVSDLDVSFSGEVEAICQANLKASIVYTAQTKNIPLTDFAVALK